MKTEEGWTITDEVCPTCSGNTERFLEDEGEVVPVLVAERCIYCGWVVHFESDGPRVEWTR